MIPIETIFEIEDEINSNGRPVVDHLTSLFNDKNIKVVAIGDSEHSNNFIRKIGSDIVENLASKGLSHFALEASQTTSKLFVDCMKSKSMRLHEERLAGTRWFCSHDIPDVAFFEMLFKVQDLGIDFLGVDEEPENGKYNYRDKTMADAISKAVHIGGRVLLWGGFTHHYSRDNVDRTSFLSAVEILKDRLGPDAVFSVHEFTGASIGTPQLVEAAKCPTLCKQEALDRSVSRCAFGPCPGQACHDHKPKPNELKPVIYRYWDGVICH